MAGARLTRHELKSKDEITSSLQGFGALLETRKKEVLITIVAAVVLVLAVVGWRAYSANRNAAAASQLGAAIAAFEDTNVISEKARYEKASAEAKKVIDAYPSLSAGVIAKYYLAMSQERLGDIAGAEKNIQEVVAQGDGSIKGIAQFALAHIQAQHGGTPKAIETLTQLYTSGDYPKSAVAFDLASLYETSGQKDKAKEYYSKVVLDSPESRFRQESEAALKRMGFEVPVPPPAPVAATTAVPVKK